MLSPLKNYATSLATFLSDAGHRRAVAALIMAVALHFGGVALDIEHIDTLIALMVPVAAAWTNKTPKTDNAEPEGE